MGPVVFDSVHACSNCEAQQSTGNHIFLAAVTQAKGKPRRCKGSRSRDRLLLVWTIGSLAEVCIGASGSREREVANCAAQQSTENRLFLAALTGQRKDRPLRDRLLLVWTTSLGRWEKFASEPLCQNLGNGKGGSAPLQAMSTPSSPCGPAGFAGHGHLAKGLSPPVGRWWVPVR